MAPFKVLIFTLFKSSILFLSFSGYLNQILISSLPRISRCASSPKKPWRICFITVASFNPKAYAFSFRSIWISLLPIPPLSITSFTMLMELIPFLSQLTASFNSLSSSDWSEIETAFPNCWTPPTDIFSITAIESGCILLLSSLDISIVEINSFSFTATRIPPTWEPDIPRFSVKPTVNDTSVKIVSLYSSISSWL